MKKSIVFCVVTLFVITPVWAQELRFGFVDDSRILLKFPAVQEVQRVLEQETGIWENEFQDRQQLIAVYLDSIKNAQTAIDQARQAVLAARADSSVKQEAGSKTAGGGQGTAAVAGAITDSAATGADTTAVGQTAGKASAPKAAEPEPVVIDTFALKKELERLESRAERIKKEVVAFYREIYGEDGVLERRGTELSQTVLERISQAVAQTCEKDGTAMVFGSSVLLYVDQEYNLTDKVLETMGLAEEQQR
ncbi:MAG: OmpH family outer membrane protein [Gemmatimonadota bacterium]|nr:OmpH family outer membrane protein [Gemmatimonadota bacterium]